MKLLVPFFLALAIVSSEPAALALPRPVAAVYSRGVPLTVAGYAAGNPALANYPVLVRISPSAIPGFDYSDMQSPATGADVAFIDMFGNGLPFEIDTWNPNGESLVWVKLPSMENGTQFVMCWGSATPGKALCPDNPWSGYAGVWHMGDPGSGAVTVVDSTANGLDGTAHSTSSAVAAGMIGAARHNTTCTDHTPASKSGGVTITLADAAKRAVVDGITPEFTASMWVRPTHAIRYEYLISRKRTDGTPAWGAQTLDSFGGAWRFYSAGSSDAQNANPAISTTYFKKDTWIKFDFVWRADGTYSVYVNGECDSNHGTKLSGDLYNKANAANGTLGLYLGGTQPEGSDKGGRGFYGEMDEIRLRPGDIGANWAKADYDQVVNSSFLSPGLVEPYEETADPLAGLVVSGVGYTNATLSVSVASLGAGATSANVTVQIAASADFAAPIWTDSYAVSGADTCEEIATGLATGTTYWARIHVENSAGATLTSTPVSFTTLVPGAPAGTAAFVSRGLTTIEGTGTLTDFGTGSTSATLCLEASESDDFASVVASPETAAALNVETPLTVSGLEAGTDYHLRLRIVNEWSITNFVPVTGTITTLGVPIIATAIGYSFAGDGQSVNFTFGVSEVFDNAACTAVLTYGGRVAGSRDFQSPGTLQWPGVQLASSPEASVTVTAVVDGLTYSQTWTTTVIPGSSAVAPASLMELSQYVVHVGDKIVLPSLSGLSDYYLPLDVRPFVLEEDGITLTAVEPGFTSVCAMEWDTATEAFVRNPAMGLAICAPECAGRVFVAQAGGGNLNWSDTTKWRNAFDPGAEAACPDGVGDVAIVPLAAGKVLTLDRNVKVGALFIGWDESAPASGSLRIGGNNCTLTFDTGMKDKARQKLPGLLRVTGLTRADVNSDRPNFYLGSSSSSSLLTLALPDGLDIDGGKCPDYTNTTLRNNHNRLRFWNGNGNLEVPAGKTLHLDNFDHSTFGDSQMQNCSSFRWEGGFPVYGAGTIVYDSAALGYFRSSLKNFTGTLVIRQKQRYCATGVDSRGGGFFLFSSRGNGPANATFVIEGELSTTADWFPNAARQCLGLATYGNVHAYGAFGPSDNSFGGKAMVLAGGTLMQRGDGNNDWAKNGIYNLPNRSDALVVSNGYSVINQSMCHSASPTNRMEFASLGHANRGTLCVMTTDTANYQQTVQTLPSHCIVRNAASYTIGGGGADGSFTESIIPWIVSSQQWHNRLYFPHFGTRDGETDCIVLTTHPTTKTSLAAANNPLENVLVNEKTIALESDLTVNALYLNKNWSKGTALGAGRTLTVTSGGVVLEGERCAIGRESDFSSGTAGILRLPNEGYLYSTRQSSSEPNEVWASIFAPRGLAISFPGYLRLGGNQTGIDEELVINGCAVTFGSEQTGCEIDVPVRLESGAASLRIAKQGSFCQQDLTLNDHAEAGPKFIPAPGTQEIVHKLYLNNASAPRGFYGSSEAADELENRATASLPAFVDDAHFSGTGWVMVQADDLRQATIIQVR